MSDNSGRERCTTAAERGLRADAERNRERVLRAAREVFAEQGLDASTNEIARRAGVGVATLFRRFPTRDELVGAAFADKMSAYAAAIDDALADTDPWHGFCGFIERVCQMQADDRGFADVLTMTFPTAKALEEERDRTARALAQLLDRAKATGRLREDFAHQDVPLILMANAGVDGHAGRCAGGVAASCRLPHPVVRRRGRAAAPRSADHDSDVSGPDAALTAPGVAAQSHAARATTANRRRIRSALRGAPKMPDSGWSASLAVSPPAGTGSNPRRSTKLATAATAAGSSPHLASA